MKILYANTIRTALAAALLVSTCSISVAQTKGDIGYVGFALDTAFLSSLAKEVEGAIKAAGYTPRLAHADGDATKQAGAVNTLVSSGVAGVLVDPVDAQGIVPVIERAAQAGVPIVPIDGSAAGGNIPAQVATDNYGAGEAACKIIGDLIGGKGTVLNLQGALDNIAAQGRTDGFTDCMKANYPNVTVVSKTFNWASDQCAQVAQATLTTQQIDGVYAASAACLTPVQTVLRRMDRLVKVNEKGHVPFITIDGTPEELNAVREGYLTASIAQPLADIAKYGVEYLVRHLEGEKITAGPTDHGTTISDFKGTLRDLLPPITVTQKNVDDPTLWANRK